MTSKETVPVKTVDSLLKNLLILSRTVDLALERGVVRATVTERFSTSKVQILRLLGNRGSRTSTQIARFLGVSKPAVTQLIDSMVRHKLVVRRTAKHDRREVDLRLTEKGKTRFQAVRQQQRQLLSNAVKQAAGPNAKKWAKTLEDIAVALAQAGKTSEYFCLQCVAHADESCVLSDDDAECVFTRREKLSERAPSEPPKTKNTTRRNVGRKKATPKRSRKR